MTWTKVHPRPKGELEFHFANELRPPETDKIIRAVARHDRRHAHR